MDQYGALLCGFIAFCFFAFLVLWMTRYSTNQETFDEVLKKREETLEILVGSKKDKKKKVKKGKIVGGDKKKTKKLDTEESSNADTDVNLDVIEPQQSRPSPVRPDDVIKKAQPSGRNLDSGTVHQRKTKTKGESEFSCAKNDTNVQVRSAQSVSGANGEAKVVSKFVSQLDGRDKRGRMEELDEIYPIEVGNWSHTTNTTTSSGCTEDSFVTDGRKKTWQESTFRGEKEKEQEQRTSKCCQELKCNFENLLKQNQDQKSEIDMLRSTVHTCNVQHLNETQKLRERHDEETKKLVGENRELTEENRIMQEATAIKNKQLEAMNLAISDLKQKIDIMGSALETNAKMYNSSENGRKNAESRMKQFEARIKEMESAARQENIAVQRCNDVAQKLQAKTEALQQAMAEVEILRIEIASNADALQAAMAEVETLRKENVTLNGSHRDYEELKKSITLLKSEKEALQNWNDASMLRLSQMESSLSECRRTSERQLREMEETLKKKDSEIGQLIEDKKNLLFRLSQLEYASNELEAAQMQKRQLEERLKEGETKIEQLKQIELQLMETIQKQEADVEEKLTDKQECSTTAPNSPLHSMGSQREVTVFTHVNEKAQWDMSQLVLDLDTKEAEINILQSLLTQRETKLKQAEKENLGLSATIEQLQNEIKPKESSKGDENFWNINGLTETQKNVDQKELHQELSHQLHLAQNEVKKLEKELKVLRGSTENLTDIDFAYRCVEKSLTNIVDEMEEKMEEKVKDLQDRLDVAEAEKLETFLQLSQLRATHELVLGELHDLRQTVTTDSFKEDLMTDRSLPQLTQQ